MPTPTPSRNEQLTHLFSTLQPALLACVARAMPDTHMAAIEDACGFAWAELVRSPSAPVHDSGQALAWLSTVAIRQAIRAARRDRSHATLTDHAQQVIPADVNVEDVVFGRARLRALRHLPERQRRLLLLHAAGYTYADLAAMTGSTCRTIDRQLTRARRGREPRTGDDRPDR